MAAQFCYGVLNGHYVHVRDLDPAVARGRRCGCLCPQCTRPLQAHLGDEKAWHFQHEVEDVNCNPQPMTLLHAFVRDQLALKRELWLPGGSVVVYTEAFGRKWSEKAQIPDRVYTFDSGVPEKRFGNVQPDVVFHIPDKWDLAVEVRYTHAVDGEKLARLKETFRDCVELDVSDLPASGVTVAGLDTVLRERTRWTWLTWMERVWAEGRLQSRILWEQKPWRADVAFFREVKPYKPHAAAKLRQAQKRLDWAKDELLKLQAWNPGRVQRDGWLGSQDLVDRVALACAAMGIQPEALPDYFAQRVQMGMEKHPYAWQLPIFARFGVGSAPFTSKEVAVWIKRALPECESEHADELSLNGFSRAQLPPAARDAGASGWRQ